MGTSGPTTVPWKDIFDEVQANNLESVKRRVEQEHFPLNQVNANNETVAHVAAKEKNLVMLKYLLGKEPRLLDAKDKSDHTVLSLAIDKGALDVVRYLVDDLKADIHQPHNQRFGNTAIHIAAEEDQVEILKYLVEEKKMDVNSLNYLQESPIFLAVERPSMGTLKYLAEKTNANVTALDSNRDNVLYASAMAGDLRVPKYFLDERKVYFDINWQDMFGRTLVYVASRFNKLDYIKYCVEEKGANIHLANNRGWTPLFEASYIGNADVIKYLVEKGADMNHTDIGAQTLEMIAEKSVQELLNKTRHERVPRSVPDSVDFANSFSTYESKEVPARSRIIYAALAPELSSGDARPTLPNDVGIAKWENFLAIANFAFGYGKDSLFWKRKEALLSPKEMIRARINLEAVEAVAQLPDNF